MPPKKKVHEAEKPERDRYVVSDREGRLKYAPKNGEDLSGYALETAKRLALPADTSHDYEVISVGEWLNRFYYSDEA